MDYKTEKVKYISHEVKNQLSICDLYTEIIKKYCEKNNIKDDTILKSVESIKRAVLMAGNSLLELKSANEQDLEKYDLNSVLEEAVTLAEVYALNKGVKFNCHYDENCSVVIDKNRFKGVIINLIKNACEAFSEEKDKKIEIRTEKVDSVVKIRVINNAKPIENPDEIFNEGVTTKETGSGLGLYISKKNMEEMSGTLNLIKSDEVSTEFEIMLSIRQ